MLIHYDLFAGIGGFSFALDNVYERENTKHIFVEKDEFCTKVLKKHWQEGEYYGDIREFIAHADNPRRRTPQNVNNKERQESNKKLKRQLRYRTNGYNFIIVTGGFPCQPFSQAGRRKGTADDRYLWKEMFESIKILRPDWVVAENVAGLITWNNGVVLEQVCADLESEGYEVQAYIIPACAVNAPHRRDRIWIVAYASTTGTTSKHRNTSDTKCKGYEGNKPQKGQNPRFDRGKLQVQWTKNWVEVAARFCRVDDGVSYWVDGRRKRRNSRNERIKSLGNAIVPQVAEMIFNGIKQVQEEAQA